MATYDVTLPASQPVVFPRRCVVCEAKNPDGIIRLSFLGSNSDFYGSNTLNKVQGIPACPPCANRLRRYHRLLKIAYYTVPIPGVILFFLLNAPLLVRILIALGCAVSPGIVSLIFPPPLGATFRDGQANFEFKSKLVAEEFLKLNSEE